MTDIKTIEDALLKDIFSHPEEDTFKLIYADWLEDEGRPERAEWVRTQCEKRTNRVVRMMPWDIGVKTGGDIFNRDLLTPEDVWKVVERSSLVRFATRVRAVDVRGALIDVSILDSGVLFLRNAYVRNGIPTVHSYSNWILEVGFNEENSILT